MLIDWLERFVAFCPAFILGWASPKQEEKAVDLQHDADDGPANQHDEDTTEEETGGLHLVLLEEEAERPLQANDKGETGHKQDLQQESQGKWNSEKKKKWKKKLNKSNFTLPCWIQVYSNCI